MGIGRHTLNKIFKKNFKYWKNGKNTGKVGEIYQSEKWEPWYIQAIHTASTAFDMRIGISMYIARKKTLVKCDCRTTNV